MNIRITKILRILLLIILPVFSIKAQNNSDQKLKINSLKVETDLNKRTLNIDFKIAEVVDNLLVRINDSSGQTIFLDNQYRFSGNYKQSVNLLKQGKGFYTVEIVGDKELLNKKLELK